MNCPVCRKALASTISVCFSCGAMVKDTIREELEVKPMPIVSPVQPVKAVNQPRSEFSPMKYDTNQTRPENTPIRPNFIAERKAEINNYAAPKAELSTFKTGEISVKTTVPTLVGFQNKNVTLPDWRLKIQNAVQQRKSGETAFERTVATVQPQTRTRTNGANALKTEYIAEPAKVSREERMARVLERIETSRQAFLIEEVQTEYVSEETPSPVLNFPTQFAQKAPEITADAPQTKARINVLTRPKLVSSMRNENGDLDTNKLPALSSPKAEIDLDSLPTVSIAAKTQDETKFVTPAKDIHITNTESEILTGDEPGLDEADDLAPFSMRFNAGLFDLILGSFAGLILLAPLMLSGGEWFSFKGFMAFVVVTSIVMFIYLTTATAFYGRTLGMRLFSLELIDIEENDYPTFHQAAVNSAVYLLSLLFGGIGFLTILFNSDKRAAHDLVSGTIMIKE